MFAQLRSARRAFVLPLIAVSFSIASCQSQTSQAFIGTGDGNEGVTAQIQQTEGALGYIEYGYAKQNNLAMATLENKAGTFVEPTPESASKALASIELPADLQASNSDPAGADSYPIVTYTWLMAYKKYDDPNKAQAMKDIIEYGLNDGQKLSQELGYIPLPEEVVTKVEATANQIQS